MFKYNARIDATTEDTVAENNIFDPSLPDECDFIIDIAPDKIPRVVISNMAIIPRSKYEEMHRQIDDLANFIMCDEVSKIPLNLLKDGGE